MEYYLLLIVVLIISFWINCISARESAITKGRELAQRVSLQLLDETVSCSKIRLKRNTKGHLQFLRTYDFIVSANGNDRLLCKLVLIGKEIDSWYIPPYSKGHD